MIKTICILTLTLTSVISVPVETSTGSKGLNRPSPINPDIISDPKPKDVSTSAPPDSAVSLNRKIPAKGEKLSSEVDQHKQTDRRETSYHVASKSAFGRNQATSTTTASPKQSTTTTHESVSLKTPVTHSSSTKVKRAAESNNATSTTTTTRAPIISSSNDGNDNSAPHFVRPVPVEQILKNIHDAPRRHEPSPAVKLHDQVTDHVTPPVTTTVNPAEETKLVDDHKFHRTQLYKKKNSDNNKSTEDDEPSEEDEKDQ